MPRRKKELVKESDQAIPPQQSRQRVSHYQFHFIGSYLSGPAHKQGAKYPITTSLAPTHTHKE